jgi:single-strand DNA-binding protein
MNNLSNSVRLTGRLGAAPELRELDDDKRVAKISLATNYYHKNGKGETVQETHWHQLVLWNRQAEIAEKYLNKGSQIAIEGRLANRFYTDQDGVKRFITEVIVSEMMLLGKP